MTIILIFLNLKVALLELERIIIMGQETIMKKYIIVLLITLCIFINSSGQENSVESTSVIPKGREAPQWIIDEMDTPDMNHTDTFVEAFSDPNILIGVFEIADVSLLAQNLSPDSSLSYMEAFVRFSFLPLHLIKVVKGEFRNSVIYIRTTTPPQFRGKPTIPNIRLVPGCKWVLAMRKTSQSYREEIYGKEIEKYEFLNENTLFRLYRYGYGALCLKWPEPNELPISSRTSLPLGEPEGLVKIPESMIDDLDSIAKIMPSIQKETKDSNDLAEITKTSQVLKNDLAKNIFLKLSMKKI